MNALSAFHFLRPWWLPALLALPLLAWWWRRRAVQRNPWRDVVDAHLLPHLLEGNDEERAGAWPRWLAVLAAAFAIIALAGPGFGKDEQPLWQAQEPLVIALDLSSATLARDLPPTRLAQARAKLATLLRERAGGQVALVAFAGDAFTVAPLTEDAANVALFLDALDPGVMPDDGHRADRAIAWSQGLMRQAGFARGQILLLTDRADGTDIDAASKANAAGYRVSVLGLGTAQGGVFDTPEGLGQARLDASGLKRLAASGGGAYQALSPGDADLRALGVLDPRQDAGTRVRGQTVSRWRDDGYWLLPVVMLLCLPLFRRGIAFALLLACGLWLPMAPASAQSSSSGGSLWQRADQAEHARMQEGIAAYRQKDYPRAIERFSTVGDAEGQYNLGNALARAGRYDDAIAAYDRALALQPGMKDATFNRNLVRLAKQLPKRPQDKGEDKDKDGKGGNGGQPPQASKPGQQGQPGKPQAAPAQGKGEQAGKPPQAPPQKDPQSQSQSQADAAQRERMQQALQKQQATQPGQQSKPGQRGKPAETAEQRERRLANEAWLQRVPDDPGALLRARFQLEQQRRRGATP